MQSPKDSIAALVLLVAANQPVVSPSVSLASSDWDQKHFCHASLRETTEWAPLSQIQRMHASNQRDLQELAAGRLAGVELPEEDLRPIREAYRWVVARSHARDALTRGDAVRFRLAWSELTQWPKGPLTTAREHLLKQYALALEAGLGNLDPDTFAHLASEILGGDEQVALNSSAIRFIRGSVAYLAGSSSELEAVIVTADGPGTEAAFVTAYLTLLQARLERSPSTARRAIAVLESIETNDDDACAKPWTGRIALHMADAHLLLLELGDRDVATLESALDHAGRARRHLDPIDTPVLWARAHHISAGIFDAASEKVGRDSMRGGQWAFMAEEAYQIARRRH